MDYFWLKSHFTTQAASLREAAYILQLGGPAGTLGISIWRVCQQPQAARDDDDHRAPNYNHQPALLTNEDPTTQVEQLKMQLTDLHVQLGDKERGLADAQKKLRAAVGWHQMCTHAHEQKHERTYITMHFKRQDS